MTDSTAPTTVTKDRLLDAAEELFAAHGFSATSLRQITAAAEANLAAVNYHFGSKEALMAAVLERRLVPLNRERLERIDALVAEREVPALRDLLTAFLEPALRLGRERDGAAFLRLVGRMHAEPEKSPAQQQFFEQFRELAERLLPLIAEHVPHLPLDELLWRTHFVVGAMAHTMTCTEGLAHFSDGRCDPRDVDGALRRLVDFAEAGLRAPLHDEGDTR